MTTVQFTEHLAKHVIRFTWDRQTGKDLKSLVGEHKYCVLTGQPSSAVFAHMNENPRLIDWSRASLIIKCKRFMNKN